MAKKKRRTDSKDSAAKRTLNPPGGGQRRPPAARPLRNPSDVVDDADPHARIGQFTGRGSPGLQKK